MEEYINNNTIVKDAVYNAFKGAIICPLCSNVLIDPIMCTKCQKVYCQRCINEWSKKEKKCPNNCDELKIQKCIGKNDILFKLNFKCEACGKNFNYEEAIKHLKKCYPDKKFPEEKIEENGKENGIENIIENKIVNQNKNQTKFEKLSEEETNKMKNELKDAINITSKKKEYLIFNLK